MTEKQIEFLLDLETKMKQEGFETFYALNANDVCGRPVACVGVKTIEEARDYVERANRQTSRECYKVDFKRGVTLILKGFKGEAGKMDTWTDYREYQAPRFIA